MDFSSPPQFLYYILQALECLIYIAGVVAGVILIARKRTVPGILAAAAFLLLGLSLVIGFLVWDVFAPLVNNYGALSWGAFCLTTPLYLLGFIGLVVMVFLGIGKKEKPPSLPEAGEPPKES
jgi:hypothetical protein